MQSIEFFPLNLFVDRELRPITGNPVMTEYSDTSCQTATNPPTDYPANGQCSLFGDGGASIRTQCTTDTMYPVGFGNDVVAINR